MTVHIDYLKSIYRLEDRLVADIGAGDGTYSRQLHDAGAKVTSIEIDPVKVDRAKSNLPDSVAVLEGRAEDIPLRPHSQELICFFFSFHHVPIPVQDQSLDEVRRVLKPGARLHVVEPLPSGSMFDVVKLVEDETHVRTHSHGLMNSLGNKKAFDLLSKKDYVLTREFPDFDYFLKRIVYTVPERSAKLPAIQAEMEQIYNNSVTIRDGRNYLHQPCVAYHFALRND